MNHDSTILKFFSKHRQILLWLLVLTVTIGLRFYKLGEVPQGLTWDEAAIAYNGFSVSSTGRDEWLKLLPISFQSFGDYKAPLAIYMSGIFTKIFGLSFWAIRLPFALVGVFGVIGFGILAQQLWERYNPTANIHSWEVGLLAAGLLAISPWHLQFSRAGFESGIALSLLLCSLAIFYMYLNKAKLLQKFLSWTLLLISLLMGIATLYTYHSAKIVVPLVLLLIVILEIKWFLRSKVQTFFFLLVSVFLLTPLAFDSLYGPGATRLDQTSIFTQESSVVKTLWLASSNYLNHFSPKFLLFGQTPTLRHGNGAWGVLYLPTLLLCIFGVRQFFSKSKYKKQIIFSLGLVVFGILPAAMGKDGVPHANRALFALPGFLLLAISGYEYVRQLVVQSKVNQTVVGSHGEKRLVQKTFWGSLILLYSACTIAYLHYYYTTYASQSSEAFLAGYLEAMQITKQYEHGNGVPQVEKIIFTSDYGQPYIYALLARGTSPYEYHAGSLIKYEFKNVDVGDLTRKNALVVSSNLDDDLLAERATTVITDKFGHVRFKIFYMP